MVAEMRKLELVAMSYEKDALLNALERTGAAEIELQTENEYTSAVDCNCEDLRAYYAKIEDTLEFLVAETESYNKAHKIKAEVSADGQNIGYSDFLAAKDYKDAAEAVMEKVQNLSERRKTVQSEIIKLNRVIETAKIYSDLETPFSAFTDTAHVKVKLGVVPAVFAAAFALNAEEYPLTALKILKTDSETALALFCSHVADESGEAALAEKGFVLCPFSGDISGKENYKNLNDKKSGLLSELENIADELYSLNSEIAPLGVYSDYVGFQLEKAEMSLKMRATQTTVLMRAYVPAEAEDKVKSAIDGVTGAVYYSFTKPDKDEVPPTLYKNNAVVKNFEAITDMYSPVNSRELDPNAVMALFYSVFLGFIMADVGYGLMMLLGGGAVYWKNREKDSGLKRLAGVFAIGGICAILWGLMFNSFFGMTLDAMPTFLPNAKDDSWSFMGIKIPCVLLISLELGVCQLFAGYVCRAVQCWRRKQIWDGILDGVVWAVFSVGVAVAIVGLIEEANVPVLATVGGAVAAASLLIAVLTAGRKEKLLGKFTKGFGAAYGVINYASDILSYARLYGLMLSGAVIAQIVSEYAVTGANGGVGFIMSGDPALVILGVIIMIVGHVFNLAMGLLGAYIHDARLQYVEFYGRFYEGEGELFKPLGSSRKHVFIK